MGAFASGSGASRITTSRAMTTVRTKRVGLTSKSALQVSSHSFRSYLNVHDSDYSGPPWARESSSTVLVGYRHEERTLSRPEP